MSPRTPRIDLHSHVLPREMLDAVRARPTEYRARFEMRDGEEVLVRDDRHWTPNYEEFWNPEAKVEGMDRKGIDISVLSVTPVVFFYWLSPEGGLAAARVLNDGIARMVAARPDRLRGMATLPMQDPDAAVTELERVVREYGFRSIELGCAIEGSQLAEPKFRPVLRRAQELKVFVFTHPYFSGQVRPELSCYYLANLVSHPYETAVMAAHLMFSGTLDELPGLNIVLAHGGGHLPYQIGRVAHGYAVRKEPKAHGASPPLALLRRFFFDALTHDAAALRFLVERVGADRVTIGTDAPFDMAEDNPLAMLDALPGLSEQSRARIHGLNALELLGET